MATFFVYKIRTSCPECGEGMILEGPRLEVRCEACDSILEVTPDYWKSMLSFRENLARYGLTEGKTRGSSMMSGERKFNVLWGPQRPLCIGCGAVLDLERAPPGTTGLLPCACGKTTPTCPPPAWLVAQDPTVMQLFAAPLEVPAGAIPVGDANAARPISFACPDCGAHLKVTVDSPRVLHCTFCQSDLYLPDALWRSLHPVRKRPPFYVAFR